MSASHEPPNDESAGKPTHRRDADRLDALLGLAAGASEPPASPATAVGEDSFFGLSPAESGAGTEPLPTPSDLQRDFPAYAILDLLGRGGMGVVYQAKHTGLARLVAIKLLPPEFGDDADFAARFQREARAMARLEHPNIITVHDYGQTAEGRLYIVMEFVDGANLAQLMRMGALEESALSLPVAGIDSAGPARRVPQLDILAIAAQLCDALAFAHGEGVVHRDIKPANVMIDKRGRVKIADFGIARLIDAELDDSAFTTTGTVMGTLDYMAPEQRKGMKVDQRADIYSLGVMLYEMFCCEVPRGIFAPPSTRSGCDPRIDAIVARALQSEPALRYQTTAEMKAEVDAVRVASAPGACAVPAGSVACAVPAQPVASAVPAESVASAAPAESAQLAKPAQPSPATALTAEGRSRRKHGDKQRTLHRPLAAALLFLAVGGWFVWQSQRAPVPVASALPKAGRGGNMATISADNTAPSAGTADATQPAAIKLWDSPDKLRNWKNLPWKENALFLDNVWLSNPMPISRDAILRAKIRLNADAKDPQIALRASGTKPTESRYFVGWNGDSLMLTSMKEGRSKYLKSWPLRRGNEADRWLSVELRAVGDQISVKADDVLLGTLTDTSVPDPGTVAVFANANGYFRDIEYIPLDVASAVSADGALGTAHAPPAAEPWVDLLKPDKSATAWVDLWGGANFSGERLVVPAAGGVRVIGPAAEGHADSALRVRASFDPATGSAVLRARGGKAAAGYAVVLRETSASIELWPGGIENTPRTLKELSLPAPREPGQEYELEFRTVGSTLTVRYNGQTLGSVEDTTYPTGGCGLSAGNAHKGPATITKLEYLDLSAAAKPSAHRADAPPPLPRR